MENKVVLVDTSILIDFFRKTKKENSKLVSLVRQGYSFYISTITEYEIYSGATDEQIVFWNNLLSKIRVLPFDQICVKSAFEINVNLKRKRKQIDIADLFIAASAIANELPLVTLNINHFERIEGLRIID
jgi:tRNA(fMet)-specific endonuclease VapC